MEVVIRADASVEIGSGHIMRCLTLANYLREKGLEVRFICAETKGDLIDYIKAEGFLVHAIPETKDFIEDAQNTIDILKERKADLLIVDHYQIGISWEKKVKDSCDPLKVMVIDDLADRKHECDLLLDQNYYRDYKKRYENLLPSNCKKLLGPKFLLLRPEFYERTTFDKNNMIKNILVFYGGSDPTNETIKVLKAFEDIDLSNLNVHVVVGLSNVNLEAIKQKCEERNFHFYVQINYLAQLMRKANLALGAGGVTMWERCFIGLPSIVTVVAENQRESTEAAADYGAIWSLGWHESVKISDIVDIFNRAIKHHDELDGMSKRSKQLMHSDTEYNTQPVVEAIMEVLET